MNTIGRLSVIRRPVYVCVSLLLSTIIWSHIYLCYRAGFVKNMGWTAGNVNRTLLYLHRWYYLCVHSYVHTGGKVIIHIRFFNTDATGDTCKKIVIWMAYAWKEEEKTTVTRTVVVGDYVPPEFETVSVLNSLKCTFWYSKKINHAR